MAVAVYLFYLFRNLCFHSCIVLCYYSYGIFSYFVFCYLKEKRYINIYYNHFFVSLFQGLCSLHVYTINGKSLASELIHCPLRHMLAVEDHIVLGNNRGVIVIKEVHW